MKTQNHTPEVGKNQQNASNKNDQRPSKDYGNDPRAESPKKASQQDERTADPRIKTTEKGRLNTSSREDEQQDQKAKRKDTGKH